MTAVQTPRTPPLDPFSDIDGPAITLADLWDVLVRRWRWVAVFALLSTVVVAVGVLRQRVSYTATSTFVPENSRPAPGAGTAAIASQLGVNLNTQDALNSPQFYADLVVASWFLRGVAEAKLRVGPDTAAKALVDLLGVSGRTERDRRDRAVTMLTHAVSGSVSPRTGIITLSVTNADPVLAQQINAEILRQIAQFNVNRRQSRASAERRFIERRLAEVTQDLREAEDRLRAFLEENHDYVRSPTLAIEGKRLDRSLALQQQLYTSLSSSYEQAKIDEVRDTPLTAVLAEPEVPVVPNPRGRGKRLIFGFAIGVALGAAIAFGLEFISVRRNAARHV